MLKNELKDLLNTKGIFASDASIDMLYSYAEYIINKNKVINLTAIKDMDSFLEKMVYDSALPLLLTDYKDKRIIDVGTGAGFPGMVISILSDTNVDLLDSTNKKLKVIDEFNYKKSHTINARVEDYVKNNRESYDIVLARAVAPLNILLELCLPLVKVGGYFIALKGKDAVNEIRESKSALNKLKAEVSNIDHQILPSGEERYNILFIKKEKSPNIYPREYSLIKKKPL